MQVLTLGVDFGLFLMRVLCEKTVGSYLEKNDEFSSKDKLDYVHFQSGRSNQENIKVQWFNPSPDGQLQQLQYDHTKSQVYLQ